MVGRMRMSVRADTHMAADDLFGLIFGAERIPHFRVGSIAETVMKL